MDEACFKTAMGWFPFSQAPDVPDERIELAFVITPEPVTLADDGWDYFEQLIAWHRAWLADLPADVRRMISVENARRLFGRK